GLVLAYVDRHALPAGVTSWDIADVFQNVVNLGVPVLGFALASRRPENPMGWLFLAAGLALGLNAIAGPYGLHAVRVAQDPCRRAGPSPGRPIGCLLFRPRWWAF